MWAGYPQSKISQTSTMAQERCFSKSGSQSTNAAATNVVDHKEHFFKKLNSTVENISKRGNYVLRVIIVL